MMLNMTRAIDSLKTHRAVSLCAVGIAVAIPLCVNDYRTYLSYGPGGLPYNPAGWLLASIARMFASEQFSTSIYADSKLPLADQPGFLPASFPPQRISSRPKLGSHPIPQRQLEQLPSEELRQQLIHGFHALGKRAQDEGLVEIRQSGFERQHEALFVSRSGQWHDAARTTGGEISHVHAGLDGSLHVTLHPADAESVIQAGWGQRHGLSGSSLLKLMLPNSLPSSYLLVYAPRDDTELDIALTIVKASISYMVGLRGALD